MVVQEAANSAVARHAANEALAELLFSPEGRVDPYQRFHRLRQAAPVHHSTLGTWILSSYDAVNESLRSKLVGKDVYTFLAGRFSGEWEDHPALGKLASTMLWANPPDHTRLRRIVNRAFTTIRVMAHRVAIDRKTV
jgi:cytochrome P450